MENYNIHPPKELFHLLSICIESFQRVPFGIPEEIARQIPRSDQNCTHVIHDRARIASQRTKNRGPESPASSSTSRSLIHRRRQRRRTRVSAASRSDHFTGLLPPWTKKPSPRKVCLAIKERANICFATGRKLAKKHTTQ